MALSLNDEINHIQLNHKDKRVTFKCTKCLKIYKSKHGAQCHIPKCRGQNDAAEDDRSFACNSCGKTFATKVGLSQHERHEHPLVRNAARLAEAEKSKEKEAPRGFGKIWSKDEIELMLQLEKSLEGEKFIAKEMSQYLPNKTNKQIRDKRAEKTYRKLLQERRAQEANSENLQDTEQRVNNGSTLGEEGKENVTSQTEDEREVDPTINREQMRRVQCDETPRISVSDYSCCISEREMAWRDNFLQSTLDSHTLLKDPTEETTEIIRMLNTALIYAKEESRRVPILHIDHVYDQVISYLKGENPGLQNQRSNKQKRKKGRNKRAYKRYIYARTQDLYKRNPGELAKHVREGVDWYESPNEELQEEEIRQNFQELWGQTPEIKEPDAMKEGGNAEEIDLNDLLLPITIGEVTSRIKRIKQNTAAGPDGILRKHVLNLGTQEVLRLFFNFITACGHQPTC
jgi:hypothetical protein